MNIFIYHISNIVKKIITDATINSFEVNQFWASNAMSINNQEKILV